MTVEAASHPHELQAPVPERLEVGEVRRLSVISPARVFVAVAVEWLAIASAIAVANLADWLPVTVLAVILIGARQHALTVIAHDAAHFRLLPGRGFNDWLGNLLLAWPMFISVQGFRHFHGDHHRFLNREGDGNRELWATHGPDGRLTAEWCYPKTWPGLVGTLARRVLMLTGVYWLIRGLIGGFMIGATPASHLVRAVVLVGAITVLTLTHTWGGFLLYWVLRQPGFAAHARCTGSVFASLAQCVRPAGFDGAVR